MENRDQLDDLLDGALKRYGDVEPRVGLEGRVLARLTDGQVRRSKRWVWALGAAAVACLVITSALVGNRFWTKAPTIRRNPTAAIARKSNELASATVPEQKQEHSSRRHHRSLQVRTNVSLLAADAPHLDKFPCPRPLSEKELMLVDYVQRYPQDAVLIAKEQDQFQKRVVQAEKEIESGSSSDPQER